MQKTEKSRTGNRDRISHPGVFSRPLHAPDGCAVGRMIFLLRYVQGFGRIKLRRNVRTGKGIDGGVGRVGFGISPKPRRIGKAQPSPGSNDHPVLALLYLNVFIEARRKRQAPVGQGIMGRRKGMG